MIMLQLTLHDERKVYINPAQVVTVGVIVNAEGTALSVVGWEDELFVKEPLDKVMELIGAA